MDDLVVKVGADITGFLSKIDAAKAKVNQLTEEQGQLKTVVNDLNQSLRLNEKELTIASVKLQKLNTTTTQGKQAAAALRAEISKLAVNSRTLSDSLTGAKTNLARTTNELKLTTAQLKSAQNSVGGFAGGVKTAFSGLRNLANIIPGLGISSLIFMIAGPLVDALKTWYQGLNKISVASQILRQTNSDLNDIMKEANKDAGEQTAKLKILYQAATDVNLSMKDRLAAVKALQTQFPEYFADIKAETILNGNAKDIYNALTIAIRETARAKSALGKLSEIEAEQLDNDFKRDKIWIATTNELTAARKAGDRVLRGGGGSSMTGGGTGAADVVITVRDFEKIIEKRRDQALADLDVSDKILKGRRDFVTKFVGISKLAKTLITPEKTPGLPKAAKDIETVNDVLAAMREQIKAIKKEEDFFNVDKSLEKLKLVQGVASKLFKDFKLETTDPHILALDFEFSIAERGRLRDELSKIVPKEVGIPIALTLAPSSAVFPVFQQLTGQVLPEVEKLNQQIAATLESGLEGALSGVGEAIGTAIAEGGDIGAAIFGTIFQTLGSALQSLGKVAIEVGIGIKAIKAAFKTLNPIVAIAAGIAMIAVGALIKNSVGKIGGFATGGPVTGPGTRTSDSILARLSKGEFVISADAVSKFGPAFFELLNRGFMPRGMASGGSVGSNSIGGGQLITVQVEGNLRGRDIHISNKRTGIMLGHNG